jgi:Animal haem peroxidase
VECAPPARAFLAPEATTKLKSFQDLSSDPDVQSELERCYGDINDVEFYPGLFAEDVRKQGILPTLMATMVAVDAFSQARSRRASSMKRRSPDRP